VKGGGGGNLLPAKQFCRDELSVEEDGFDTARALECSASQLAFHILENDLGQNAQAYQYLPGLSGSKSVRQVARSATLKKPVASVEKLHRSADLAKIGQASRERPSSLNKPDIFPEVHGLTYTPLASSNRTVGQVDGKYNIAPDGGEDVFARLPVSRSKALLVGNRLDSMLRMLREDMGHTASMSKQTNRQEPGAFAPNFFVNNSGGVQYMISHH